LDAATSSTPTIGVFSITGGAQGTKDTMVILEVVGYAAEKLGNVRLSVFGRHAELRESDLRRGFAGTPVDLRVDGVVEPLEVVQKLRACDVLLFVRGAISSRRGSAIAGIAAGLPVLAYENWETASPITDAGLMLAPLDQHEQLKEMLVRVLSDEDFRAGLASRSRTAYEAHFAWPVIAARFAEILKSS
jgi:glycosyltransferase involved in cell wall biosynthesis